jgi:hypothetical protein
MGNIYSEVGRFIKSKGESDTRNHDAAAARAIDILNITILILVKQKLPKVREVLCFKEQFLNIINDKHVSYDSIYSLNRYFMQFATAARLKR